MNRNQSERGATLITVAIMLVVIISLLALAIDIGVGYLERRRVQAIADAAALAGVQVLVNNHPDSMIISTVDNYVLTQHPLAPGETRSFTIHWMRGNTTLTQQVGSGARPSGITGILVTVRGALPTYFAGVLPGRITQMTSVAEGGGGYSPLDLMLVMDRSGSMEFYSCNWQPYFNSGGPCASLIGTHYPNEYDRQEQVYYHCLPESGYDRCEGLWRRPSSGQPRACYFDANGTYTKMLSVPPGCSSISNESSCESCRARIVAPYQPITDAQNAASHFIDLVAGELGPTEPRIGLVSFASSATNPPDAHLTDMAQFNSALKPKVNALAQSVHNPGGSTNAEDGLYRARMELTDHNRVRATSVKAIVFLTDGNANRCRSGNCNETTAVANMRAEARAAQSQGIRVYAIGLGAGVEQAPLQQMVIDPSGQYSGVYLFAPTGADLQAAYAQMFAEIKRLRLVE